jgi:hypothetical protein
MLSGEPEAVDDEEEARERDERVQPFHGTVAQPRREPVARRGRDDRDRMHAEKDDESEDEYLHRRAAPCPHRSPIRRGGAAAQV